MRRWRPEAAVAAILAVGAVPDSAEAQTLILRSSAPQHPPGQRIADSTLVTLGPSQRILVLRGGGTRIYCGPASFTFRNPAGQGGCSLVARLFRPRIAGARAYDPDAERGRAIPVDRGGTLCLIGGARAHFTFPTGRAGEQVPPPTLNGTSLLVFPGEQRAGWPNAIEQRPGRYVLTDPPTGTSTTIIRVEEGEPEAVADRFVASGCAAQLAELAALVPARDFTWEEVESNFASSERPPAPSPELFGVARGRDVRTNPNLDCERDAEDGTFACDLKPAKLWDWFVLAGGSVAADADGRPNAIFAFVASDYHSELLRLFEGRYGEQPAGGWRFADGSKLSLPPPVDDPLVEPPPALLTIVFEEPARADR